MRRLRIGVDLPSRLAAGKARVGPRFISLPTIETGIVGETVNYSIGTIPPGLGTIVATMYKDEEIFLSNLTTDGSFTILEEHAGSRFHIKSVATNSFGNETEEISDDMFVDSPPEVADPTITVLEQTNEDILFRVELGEVEGNVVSEVVTISDGITSYTLGNGQILVPKRAIQGTLTVTHFVTGVGGYEVTASATETIPALVNTVPNAFDFTNIVDADVGVVYTSERKQIIGLDAAAPISITGGEYQISNDEVGTNASAWLIALGTIEPNKWVRVRGTSSNMFGQAADVVLTIGGISGTFTITTVEVDSPMATDDTFTIMQGEVLNIYVLANDIGNNLAIFSLGDEPSAAYATKLTSDGTVVADAPDAVAGQLIPNGVDYLQFSTSPD